MADLERDIVRMFCIGFDGCSITQDLRDLIDRGVRSVILFTRNFESAAQLAELCYRIKTLAEASDEPVMICVDQEGGRVQRFRAPFTIIPAMRELGRDGDADLVRRAGRVLARELRAVNIDMNLAPVLDVDSNPANPVIGERSFSSDPSRVAELGCAMIEGLQMCRSGAGVAACGKHFPGHGDTSVDSHFDLPRLEHDLNRLEQVELVPFRAAIAANIAAIMCAHVVFAAIDSSQPATMSKTVIDDLLRTQLKFDRVVCSDDMEMKAIIDHFGIEQATVCGANAGLDLFFICKDHALQHEAIDALFAAVRNDDVPDERIAQSNRRLDAMFSKFVRPASRWTDQSTTLLGRQA